MTILRRLSASFLVVLLLAPLSLAEPSDYIGKVTKVSANASIVRAGTPLPVEKNTEILPNDLLKTGPTGSLGVIFRDGTILTLGPSSEFRIQRYVFKPLEKKTSFIGIMRKGSVSYISGAIGRMNPESVKIETPTAYLGLRGTKVLVQVN